MESERKWILSVVEEYEKPLCRYAARIVRSTDLARDVVQDTFFQFCRNAHTLDRDRVGSWLYRVCRNRALDIRRKDEPMKPIDEAKEARMATNDPDPAAATLQKERRAWVHDALDGLPDPQKEAVQLKFQQGLRYREIAEVMNISVSKVGYLIHVGIKTMRAQISTL